MFECSYIHTYICMYIYKYIHTYIYIHTYLIYMYILCKRMEYVCKLCMNSIHMYTCRVNTAVEHLQNISKFQRMQFETLNKSAALLISFH